MIKNTDAAKEQEYRQEAERLTKLPARERKEALAVHWRIADDATLCKATRDHARRVGETLERELARIRGKKLPRKP